MEHDDVRYDIPAWAAGRLDPAAKRRLESHLGQCAACRAVASTAQTLARELGRDGAELFEAHPAATELERHAKGIPSSRDSELVRHLASCASCSLEHGAWQAHDTAIQPGRHPRTWRRDLSFAAAGLVAGLLLGWLVGPGTRPQRDPATALATPVPRLLLQSAIRGVEATTELAVVGAPPHVLVETAFALPPDIDPAGSLHFEILDDAGRQVWSASQPVSELAPLLAHDELVAFLVPTEVLAEGRHRLDVTVEHASSPALLSAPFGVHRSRPR